MELPYSMGIDQRTSVPQQVFDRQLMILTQRGSTWLLPLPLFSRKDIAASWLPLTIKFLNNQDKGRVKRLKNEGLLFIECQSSILSAKIPISKIL